MECWRAIVTWLLVLSLDCRSQGKGDTVVMHVLYQSSTTYLKAVTFRSNVFTEFHQCLCMEVSKTCTVRFSNAGASLNAKSVESTNRSWADGILSSFYMCTVTNGDERLLCTRQPLPTGPCSAERHSTSYKFPSATGCSLDCVGILWIYSEENIYNSKGNLLDFDGCLDHCYGVEATTTLPPQSSTTRAPATTAATTVAPTTLRPSTRPSTTTAGTGANTSENPTTPVVVTATSSTISPTTADTFTTPGNDTQMPTASAQSSNDDTGVIAGAVISVVVLLIILALVVIVVWRRRQRESAKLKHTGDNGVNLNAKRDMSTLPYMNQSGRHVTDIPGDRGDYSLARQPETDCRSISGRSTDPLTTNTSKPNINSRFSALIARLRRRLKRRKDHKAHVSGGQPTPETHVNQHSQVDTEYDYDMFNIYETLNDEDTSGGNPPHSHSDQAGTGEYGYSMIDPEYSDGRYTNVNEGKVAPRVDGPDSENCLDNDGYECPRQCPVSKAEVGGVKYDKTPTVPSDTLGSENQYSDVPDNNYHLQQTDINSISTAGYSNLGAIARTITNPYNDLMQPFASADEEQASKKFHPSREMTNQNSCYSLAKPMTDDCADGTEKIQVGPSQSKSPSNGDGSTLWANSTPTSLGPTRTGEPGTAIVKTASESGEHLYLELEADDTFPMTLGGAVSADDKHMYFELEKEEDLDDTVYEFDT